MKSVFHILYISVLLLSVSFSLRANDISPSPVRELSFVPNLGQWEGNFLFKSDIHGGQLFLEQQGFTYLFYKGDVHHGPHAKADQESKESFGRSIDLEHLHEVPELEDRHAYKVKFLGSNEVETKPFGKLSEYHNYFYGSDESKWKSRVPLFEGVRYPGLYDGIDLVVYSDFASVKYDFIVAAGKSPGQIKLKYEGLDGIKVNADGHLEMETSINTVIEYKPYAYQELNGQKVEVACEYLLKGNVLHYVFPDGYDTDRELVIDPVLVFSTYSGSTADNWGFSATFDKEGNMYIGGVAFSGGYPTTGGAFQTAFRGADTDVAITKLSANGAQRLFSTYLGGGRSEYPSSLIVDEQNNLIVYGVTSSNNFPVSANAFQNAYRGGNNITPISSITFSAGSDIFITKFNTNGTGIIGSTYYGGTANDGINSNNGSSNFATLFNYGDNSRGEVNLTPDGRILIASQTFSDNIAITPGAAQPTKSGGQDGLVACFSQDLSQLLFSTFVGGGGADGCYSVQTDNSGNLFICGGTSSNNMPGMIGGVNTSYLGGRTDGYIIKLNQNATAFLAGTYLGTGTYDQTYLLDLDRSGNVYTVGQTLGNYPVTAGVYRNVNAKQFIHKLSNNLSTTIYSTTFGTANSQLVNISPTALLVDDCENVHVVGWGGGANWDFQTSAGRTNNMPVTSDAFKGSTDGNDFYLFTLQRDAEDILFGSYFGENGSSFSGTGQDHVDGGTSRFDKQGIVYQGVCASCGGSNGFPTTAGVVSRNNRSSNCNMAGFKFQFDLDALQVLTLDVSSDSGCAPLTVTFDYTATKPGTSFEWDFGDGGTSVAEFPTYTFTQPGEYRVKFIIENPANCNPIDSAFAIIKVTEREAPVADFEIDSSQVCTNGTVILTNISQDAKRYEWNFGDGTTSTSSASPITKNYAAPGTYTITLSAFNNELCDSTDVITKTVRIPDVVEADFSFDGVYCTGSAINFSNLSTNAESYTWTFSPGNTSTETNPQFVFSAAGTYPVTLVANNPLSCNVNDQITRDIVIDEAPVLIDPIGPIELCSGQDVLLTATPGFSSYTWRRDGAVIGGANTNTYTATQTGAYQVEVTSTGTCPGISNIVEVTVQDDIDIDITPSSAELCPGEEAILTIATAGLQDIVWFRNGIQVATATESITVSQGGNYTASANTSIGCPATSTAIPVTEIQPPVITISPAGPSTICENTEITLTAAPTDLLSIQWFRDGVVIPGANTVELTTGLEGSYTLSAENSAGCPATSPASVVSVSNEITLNITPVGPIVLCPSRQEVLTISNTGIQNIQWKRDGTDIPGATSATLTVSGSGAYSATAESTQGCPGTSNIVNVTLEDVLIIEITSSAPGFCPGNNVVLNITNTGLQNIQWLRNGVALAGANGTSLTVTEGGNYSVSATSAAGCPGSSNVVGVVAYETPQVLINPNQTINICPGTSAAINLISSGLQGIQWFRNGTAIPGETGTSLSTDQAGTYFVTAQNSDNCPGTSVEVAVVIVDIIELDIAPSGTIAICEGDDLSLTINNQGISDIQWFLDGQIFGGGVATLPITQAGTYTATALSAEGCPAASSPVIVIINTAFGIDINPAGPISLCEGDTQTLTAITSNLSNIQWFLNGQPITGAVSLSFTATASGSYSITAISSVTGCDGTSGVVDLAFNPIPALQISPEQAICEGENATIVITANAADSFSWNTGESGGSITVNEAGIYTVTATLANCSAEASTAVRFKSPPPTVTLGEDTAICANQSLVLVPIGENILSYQWQDGSTTSTFVVTQAGTYTVVVEGECGVDQASKAIELLDCECQVVVPSAFTPNGDGINDILLPLARCKVEDLVFMVFNRWGEKVFESTDINLGWDGIFRSLDQPTDAYVYYVKYKNIPLNKYFENKGAVVLIR
jgi:gliding motility-associated-like protein